VTIGFPAPLRYERKLVLRVTVNEPNVVQILGNVIRAQRDHGTADRSVTRRPIVLAA
jgi:hypothetical protein